MLQWLKSVLAGTVGGIFALALLLSLYLPWEAVAALSGWVAAFGAITAALITLGPFGIS